MALNYMKHVLFATGLVPEEALEKLYDRDVESSELAEAVIRAMDTMTPDADNRLRNSMYKKGTWPKVGPLMRRLRGLGLTIVQVEYLEPHTIGLEGRKANGSNLRRVYELASKGEHSKIVIKPLRPTAVQLQNGSKETLFFQTLLKLGGTALREYQETLENYIVTTGSFDALARRLQSIGEAYAHSHEAGVKPPPRIAGRGTAPVSSGFPGNDFHWASGGWVRDLPNPKLLLARYLDVLHSVLEGTFTQSEWSEDLFKMNYKSRCMMLSGTLVKKKEAAVHMVDQSLVLLSILKKFAGSTERWYKVLMANIMTSAAQPKLDAYKFVDDPKSKGKLRIKKGRFISVENITTVLNAVVGGAFKPGHAPGAPFTPQGRMDNMSNWNLLPSGLRVGQGSLWSPQGFIGISEFANNALDMPEKSICLVGYSDNMYVVTSNESGRVRLFSLDGKAFESSHTKESVKEFYEDYVISARQEAEEADLPGFGALWEAYITEVLGPSAAPGSPATIGAVTVLWQAMKSGLIHTAAINHYLMMRLVADMSNTVDMDQLYREIWAVEIPVTLEVPYGMPDMRFEPFLSDSTETVLEVPPTIQEYLKTSTVRLTAERLTEIPDKQGRVVEGKVEEDEDSEEELEYPPCMWGNAGYLKGTVVNLDMLGFSISAADLKVVGRGSYEVEEDGKRKKYKPEEKVYSFMFPCLDDQRFWRSVYLSKTQLKDDKKNYNLKRLFVLMAKLQALSLMAPPTEDVFNILQELMLKTRDQIVMRVRDGVEELKLASLMASYRTEVMNEISAGTEDGSPALAQALEILGDGFRYSPFTLEERALITGLLPSYLELASSGQSPKFANFSDVVGSKVDEDAKGSEDVDNSGDGPSHESVAHIPVTRAAGGAGGHSDPFLDEIDFTELNDFNTLGSVDIKELPVKPEPEGKRDKRLLVRATPKGFIHAANVFLRHVGIVVGENFIPLFPLYSVEVSVKDGKMRINWKAHQSTLTSAPNPLLLGMLYYRNKKGDKPVKISDEAELTPAYDVQGGAKALKLLNKSKKIKIKHKENVVHFLTSLFSNARAVAAKLGRLMHLEHTPKASDMAAVIASLLLDPEDGMKLPTGSKFQDVFFGKTRFDEDLPLTKVGGPGKSRVNQAFGAKIAEAIKQAYDREKGR